MVLTQYSNFFSLFIFTALLIPGIILGVCGKKIKWYGIFVSAPSLYLIMGFHSVQMLQFAAFIIFEAVLVLGYYYFSKKAKSEFVYFLVLFLSALPVFYAKLSGNISGLLNFITAENHFGFIGISYISFRIWQLIIEIHDNHIEKLPVLDLLYFITFFPTINSGPIDRFNRFVENLNKKITSDEYVNDYLISGFKKIFTGIVYKFAVASLIHACVIEKLPANHSFLSALIYMYAYTFYLFFDFAGYSNFAVGTGCLLGIRVPENFNRPFFARNMKEFWDRWHISLSKWFGDYVFSRFFLNTIRNGTFKNKKSAARCSYMLTMILMGIWHGFYLFYLLYGIYHGLMLVLTDVYIKSKFYRNFKKSKFYDAVSIAVTFHAVAFGLLLFSGYLFKF
jgi:membrane protein involved in D-alanine export